MNKAELREALSGAEHDPVYRAVVELLAEFREECVETAKDMALLDKAQWAALGAVMSCDDFKEELAAQVRKASEAEEEGEDKAG